MSAAPPPPLPPFLPTNLEQFATHIVDHNQEWYEYCRGAYDYIRSATAAATESSEGRAQSDLRLHALQQEVDHWKREAETQRIENQAVRKYQDELLQRLQEQLARANIERDQALQAAVPTVNTPVSPPTHEPAKGPTGPTVGTPLSAAPPPSETSHLSERVPDTDKFEGNRKDLRRFTSQIYGKMNTNRDRFPTPQSRMTYVTSRLKGLPYDQILPYIHKGVCKLNDYEDILDILDRAFGDPNRVNNARNDLFRLRQTNKDFGTFFAEFQRLALEGEMPEETLPTLLEQAINRELRGMLMHNEPPSRKYHQFAAFLQDLENRHRHYETPMATAPAVRTYAAATRPSASANPTPPRPADPPGLPRPERTQGNVPPAQRVNPDAMDLSSTRRTQPDSRRERGECFRCGSTSHQVRDCPQPDNRLVRARSMTTDRRYASASPSPPPSPVRGRHYARSPSPDNGSGKGVSLA
jgi:hypothetical protein